MRVRLRRFITQVEADRRTVFGLPLSTGIVIGLAILTLVFGLVYAERLGETTRFYDEGLYLRLAEHLSESHAYSLDRVTPSVYRPPGYNFSLYPVFKLGGRAVHVRVMQFVLLALSLVLLHYILRVWSYPLASLIVGGGAFAYPVLFYSAGTIYPQTVTTFIFLLVCLCVVRPQASLTQWLLGGLAFGGLLLVTPIFLVLLPLLLIWPWVLNMHRKVWANIVLIIAVVLVVTPWLVRNYRAFDQFVFISANSGLMLILGNSENTRPNAGSTTDISKYSQVAESQDMSKVDEDRYLRREAIKWISNHKTEAIKLYFMKFLNYFNFRNELDAKAENTWWRAMVMFITYYLLLGLAGLRIARGQWLRSRPFEGFAVASYLIMGIAYAVFFTRIRYRLPIDWMLIALAAISVASFFEADHRNTGRRRRGRHLLEWRSEGAFSGRNLAGGTRVSAESNPGKSNINF